MITRGHSCSQSATKVYAYYKKASPGTGTGKSVSSILNASDEPRFGTPDWWHMNAESFSTGEGSAP
jgi:hypothetical protein